VTANAVDGMRADDFEFNIVNSSTLIIKLLYIRTNNNKQNIKN